LEKAMATYSSTLAWQIPWMEEPGRISEVEDRMAEINLVERKKNQKK